MDIVGLNEVLKSIPVLDVSLYGFAGVLALIMRYARAWWLHVNGGWTLAVALVLGLAGAGLVLSVEHRPWQMIIVQGVSLTAAVLIGESILRGLAGKISWLPHDNAYVTPTKVEPTSTGGNDA